MQGKIPSEKKALELRNQIIAGHSDEAVLIEKEVNGVFACHSGVLEGERVGWGNANLSEQRGASNPRAGVVCPKGTRVDARLGRAGRNYGKAMDSWDIGWPPSSGWNFCRCREVEPAVYPTASGFRLRGDRNHTRRENVTASPPSRCRWEPRYPAPVQCAVPTRSGQMAQPCQR